MNSPLSSLYFRVSAISRGQCRRRFWCEPPEWLYEPSESADRMLLNPPSMASGTDASRVSLMAHAAAASLTNAHGRADLPSALHGVSSALISAALRSSFRISLQRPERRGRAVRHPHYRPQRDVEPQRRA